MKTFTRLISICALIVGTAFGFNANALSLGDTFSVGNLTFKVNSSTLNRAMVIGFSSSAPSTVANVNIPGYVRYNNVNYHINAIETNAFNNRTDIKTVSIAPGIIVIYNQAFAGCTSLTSVRIPSTTEMIRSNSFNGCSNLNYVAWAIKTPPRVRFTDFDQDAFAGIPSSAKLYVAYRNSVTAFRSNSAISSAFQSSNIVFDATKAHDIALSDADNSQGYFVVTKQLDEANPISYRGEAMLVGYSTGSVRIPRQMYDLLSNTYGGSFLQYYDVTAVADSAFMNKTAVTSVDIINQPSKLRIGKRAFYNCSNLTSLVTDNSATEYDDFCFYGCAINKNQLMLDKATRIGAYAFKNNKFIKEVVFDGDLLEEIGYRAFENCLNMEKYTMLRGGSYSPYSVVNGILYTQNRGKLLHCPPSNPLENGMADFHNNEVLKNIGAYAFASYHGNQRITVPYGVVSFEEGAFENSEARIIEIPSSVKNFYGDNHFIGCSQLQDLVLNIAAPIVKEDGKWLDINHNGHLTIRVPHGALRDYTSCSPYNSGAYRTHITEGAYDFLNTDKYYGLSVNADAPGCVRLVNAKNSVYGIDGVNDPIGSLYLTDTYKEPDNYQRTFIVTGIEDDAFNGHQGLQNIFLRSSSLTTIGARAFYNSKLSGRVNLSDALTLTTIGHNAFSSCPDIFMIFLPDSQIDMPQEVWDEDNTYLKVYVTNTTFGYYHHTAEQWGGDYATKLMTYIERHGVNNTFSSMKSNDVPESLAIYTVSGYNASTGILFLTPAPGANSEFYFAAAANSGYIYVPEDENEEKECLIESNRPYAMPSPNYLMAATGEYDNSLGRYNNENVALNSNYIYYTHKYVGGRPCFQRVTAQGTCTFAPGTAYLRLPASSSLPDRFYYETSLVGDLNGDGFVNSGDVSALYTALLAGSTDSLYDLNGDGNINIGDVSTLYGIILGQ